MTTHDDVDAAGPSVESPRALDSTQDPAPRTDHAPRLPEDWPTGRLMSAITRRVEREWNAHLARWELNHASLPVLAHLAGGPRSQRQLAESCGVTEQTMSKTLARLERTGYVERPIRPGDRRRHDVLLTAAGYGALSAAGASDRAEEMVLRGLDAEQTEQLRRLLLHMLAAQEEAESDGDEALDEATG
ncbi:MarR family winged helix-turn-helix transcriptional regulator [Actinotalea sp.]|uniref:MarR family winged helix-turn-helix transcriptional regulator n=1 Tax=Actinotalea sp. TaxID=1872145 RepID=UPI00356422B4